MKNPAGSALEAVNQRFIADDDQVTEVITARTRLKGTENRASLR